MESVASSRWPRAVLAGVAAFALLTPLACSAIPSASDVRDTNAPATSTPAGKAGAAGAKNGAGMPLAPERYYAQKLNWKQCAGGSSYQCAALEVPLDYAKPEASIRLRVLKVPARSADQRRGSLVVNPGGPGGSGVQYAAAAGQVFTPAVLQSYDIIGFDPRGVGEPDRVACLDDPAMESWLSMDDTPDTPQEEKRWRDVLAGWGRPARRTAGRCSGTSARWRRQPTWTFSAASWGRRSSTISGSPTGHCWVLPMPRSSRRTWARWCSTVP